MDYDICPLCGEEPYYYQTGSNIHMYKLHRCPNEHEWAEPYTEEEVAFWKPQWEEVKRSILREALK